MPLQRRLKLRPGRSRAACQASQHCNITRFLISSTSTDTLALLQ